MIKFYFDKKLIIFQIIYLSIYILLTLKVWFHEKAVLFDKTINDMTGYIVLFVLVYYFVYSIRLIVLAYRKIPGLTISEESIYFYQRNLTFFWKDIKSYKLWNKMMVLELNNTKVYIKSIKNPLRYIFSKVWYTIFGSKKFRFDLRILDTDAVIILKRFEEYNQASQEFTHINP